MVVRQLKGSEFLESLKLSSICFNNPFNTEGRSEEEHVEFLRTSTENKALNDISVSLGAFSDTDELMSILCLVPYDFYFDGTSLPGTGIGNVCTYPQHRRKGAVRELFIDSMKRMYEGGSAFSYLYPFNETFYNKFGYQRLNNSLQRNLSLVSLPEEKPTGSFHLLGLDATEDEFQQVYHAYASKLNLMVKRDEMDWKNIRDAKASLNNNYAYLYKDSEGTPRGYLVIKGIRSSEHSFLACREFIFDSQDTLKALLSFARTYASNYRSIRFYTPIYYNLDSCCRDYTNGVSTVSLAHNGMLRVINAQKVLEAATYRGTGTFTLQLADSYIAENNKLFTITYKDGKATTITTNTTTINTEETPDALMSIDQFSAAIVGSYDPRDFEYLDNCKITCSPEKLGEIFYKKPCFINNYF